MIENLLLARDRYGRPIITPPGGGVAVPYTRASTFCSTISDSAGIAKWKLRHLAIAMARYGDLADKACTLEYGRDNADLDDIIESALDRIGTGEKANYGTAVHSATELDRNPDNAREKVRADAEAYHRLVAGMGLVIVEEELFVVQDDYLVAGTFDRVFTVDRSELPPRADDHVAGRVRVIGDIKTGSLHLHEHAIQLATYASSQRYDAATGERADLDVRQDYGLVLHVPRHEARAVAVWVDLAVGRSLMALADRMRYYRVEKNHADFSQVATPTVPEEDPVLEQLERAATYDELVAVYREHRDDWGKVRQQTALARSLVFQELGGVVVS